MLRGTMRMKLAAASAEAKLRNNALIIAHENEREAKLEALAAMQTKADFLANVSHELRTPLNGVLGMLQLLDEPNLSRQQRAYVRTAEESGQLLLQLIGDVLDFSKADSDHLVLDAVAIDLHTLINSVMSTFRAGVKNRPSLALVVTIEPTVPRYVRIDPTRLQQILNNLISNAIKFTSVGNVTLSVKHENQGEGRAGLHFDVTDTGVGIPAEAMARVFQPFTQADSSTTRKFGGTGLGLAICKQLVERMSGSIGATSEPGRGSTFYFTIPVQTCDRADSEKLEMTAPDACIHPTREPLGRAPRVLVVDDNEVNRKVAGGMLGRLGCEVIYAINGREALAQWSGDSFDMTLLDCQMPEVDGYEAVQTLRRREQQSGRPRAVVIGLTANAMAGDREKCLAAGMDDYLPKPLERARLTRVLTSFMTARDQASANPDDNPQQDARAMVFHRA